MKWFWGLLIIAIGLIILSINFNLLSSSQVNQLVNFWPIILILFGVSLIFRPWRFGWVIILSVFIFSFLFIYEAVIRGLNIMPQSVKNTEIKTSAINVDLPSTAKKVQINLKTGAVSLNLKGDSDKLVSGRMQSNFLEPKISTSTVNDVVILDISTDRFNSSFWGANWGTKNTLDLALTNNIPIELNIDAGASSMDLNFSNVVISKLEIKAGASAIKLALGEKIEDKTLVKIDAGASSVEIKTPNSVGVQINTNTGLSSKDFKDYTKISDNIYQSKDYQNTIKKIEIELKAGASSIKAQSI
ncbi:MAG: toast rack family protein [Patescibacteria group bacterium]|nr:toast rack family protein [Patescibacteria group bacterium]